MTVPVVIDDYNNRAQPCKWTYQPTNTNSNTTSARDH